MHNDKKCSMINEKSSIVHESPTDGVSPPETDSWQILRVSNPRVGNPVNIDKKTPCLYAAIALSHGRLSIER
jgi:hypothetical protein